jgi:hypothetical protein
MIRKKRLTGKAHWIVDMAFVLGIVIVLAGLSLNAAAWSPVLSRIFTDLGAGVVISSVIAHLLS